MTDETAKQILDALTTQNFQDFHDGELEDFVTGGFDCSYDDIQANLILEIKYIFRHVDALNKD